MRLLTSAVALLVLAGCGGEKATEKGSAKATATATATAKAADTIPAGQWSRRVEATCEKLRKQAYRAGAAYGRKARAQGLSKAELTAGTLALEAKLSEPWVDKLDAMPRPEGKEQLADAFRADMRRTGDLLDKTADAIRANDEATGRKALSDLQSSVVRTRTEAS